MKTSATRSKPPGWAAFALKQPQKQPFEPEIDHDPFPPITTSSPGSLPSGRDHKKKNGFSGRSFSSTLISSIEFPTLPGHKSSQKEIDTGISCKTNENKPFLEGSNTTALRKLKEAYSWADDSLIGDIMGALDNDVNKASILLEGMVSTGIFEEGKKRREVCIPSETHADPSALTAQEHLQELRLNCSTDKCDPTGKYSWENTARAKFVLGGLESLPPEPEWEDDEDIYSRHRKDAIRVMRSASQHSRGAMNAFMRGDHISAKQHSLKAREEWMAAERLNAQAAMEILQSRNDENDVWRLDLHGLHATEATQALREHLQKIESQISFRSSMSPGENSRLLQNTDVVVHSRSFESLTNRDTERSDQSHASRRRSSSLQVITGVGNHSRGQAALPAAVRSFLNETDTILMKQGLGSYLLGPNSAAGEERVRGFIFCLRSSQSLYQFVAACRDRTWFRNSFAFSYQLSVFYAFNY